MQDALPEPHHLQDVSIKNHPCPCLSTDKVVYDTTSEELTINSDSKEGWY